MKILHKAQKWLDHGIGLFVKNFSLVFFTLGIWWLSIIVSWVLLISLMYSQSGKTLIPPYCMKICEEKSEEELQNTVYRW